MRITLILSVFLFTILSSCKKEDDKNRDNISEETYGLRFELADNEGRDLIFGDSAHYNPDSIKIYFRDDDQATWRSYQIGSCIVKDSDGKALSTCRRTPADLYNFTMRTVFQLQDTIADTLIIWSANPIAAKNGSERVKLNATYNSKVICNDCDEGNRYTIIRE